jgi:ATP-binding cassette subfamily B protein
MTQSQPRGQTIRERIHALRNLPPFLRLVWQTSRPLTVFSLLLRVVRAVLPVAALYVGKLIIDEVLRLTGVPSPGGVNTWLEGGLLNHLFWLLVLEFGLAVFADILGRAGGLLDSMLGEMFTNATSIRLMEHAATLDLAGFEDSDLQDKLERARRQAGGSTWLMGQVAAQVQDVITIASFATGLIIFAPWLIALLGVALVPAFLGEAHFTAKAYALSYERTQQRRELDYARHTGASVETAKEVKIFGLISFLVERYRRLALDLYRANRKLAVQRAGWGTALTMIGTAGYSIAYAYLAWRTVAGQFTIGDLTFLAGSFTRLRGLLEGFLGRISSLAGQALYLDDLFSFFQITPSIASPAAGALPFPSPIRQGFRFEDVGFRYPGAERWAVRHLTFDLRAGEVLALVGENGAGKTTLVKLLARLYDPDEGSIFLDGHDLREYDLADLRANIGVIFQDFVRYHFTAAENIAVGRIDAIEDRSRIEAAAKSSLADEVIRNLPEGYDQIVGKRFRTGVDLSVGEWQKIAIARAYMREAHVLILDEPTASLDARAEYNVFQRFKELSRGRTAVLISHRFSSVRMADRILVLADGQIEASGTHEALLAQRGKYAELFELQAAGYR